MIQLPTEVVKVTNHNPKELIVYGSPKVGKTGALAQLPNNLIIDLEKGSSQVEALKLQANNFVELEEIGKTIMAKKQELGGKYPYDYVTIDTITELESWCEPLATVLYKDSTIGRSFNGNSVLELPNGGGYFWLRKAYVSWLNRLKTLAPTVIFVAHLKDKLLTKSGKDVSAKDLDLTGKIKNITCKDTDAIGYIYRDPEDSSKARISFTHKEELLCGSRCKHLIGQDFVITETDDKGEIVKSHWDKIFIDPVK
jgi:Cdc6-like AAA superfamily ATPase